MLDGRPAVALKQTYSYRCYVEKQSKYLNWLREFRAPELSHMMGISDKLAELNVDRFSAWRQPLSRRDARPIQIRVPEAPGA